MSNTTITPGKTTLSHIVALSGGKDSTAMAVRLHELHPSVDYVYVCTPTGDELPEMYEHWRNLAQRLGKPILPIMHPLGLNGLIDKFNSLPNWRMRWCTRMLKIEPYAAFLLKISPAISYVGLRADEPARAGGDYLNVPNVEMRYPMRDWGWTEDDVIAYLREQQIRIPARTDCARCFFQTLTEWKDLRRDHPDIFNNAAEQEQDIGATFRSPSRDQWPTDLTTLGQWFDAGVAVPNRKQRGIDACRVCRI